jgi:hypothetical protein
MSSLQVFGNELLELLLLCVSQRVDLGLDFGWGIGLQSDLVVPWFVFGELAKRFLYKDIFEVVILFWDEVLPFLFLLVKIWNISCAHRGVAITQFSNLLINITLQVLFGDLGGLFPSREMIFWAVPESY